MTKKSNKNFDFMKKWNNNQAMPLLVMVGEILKETKNMYYMSLYGDITEKTADACMKCGATITNPVSRYFGMGPYCGHHNYENPFADEETLLIAVNVYRKEYLNKITWQGWIPKSAITEMKKIIY